MQQPGHQTPPQPEMSIKVYLTYYILIFSLEVSAQATFTPLTRSAPKITGGSFLLRRYSTYRSIKSGHNKLTNKLNITLLIVVV